MEAKVYSDALQSYPRQWNDHLGQYSGFDQYRLYKTGTGESNPKWRSQIREHGNATTPRTLELLTQRSYQPFFVKNDVTWVSSGSDYTAFLQGQCVRLNTQELSHVTTDFTEDRAIARAKALDKIQKQQQSGYGLVLLGEIAKTKQMLSQPLLALRGGMHNYLQAIEYRVSKAKVRGINQDSKGRIIRSIISDTWLEYSFGWKPFLMDIENQLTALGHYCYDVHPEKVSARYINRYTTASSLLGTGGGYLKHSGNCQRVTDYALYSKFGLVADFSRNFWRDSGFSLEAFVPSLWELIPWSFAVDYFTNIGSILDSTFVGTNDVTWTSQSEVITTEIVVTTKFDGYQAGIKPRGSPSINQQGVLHLTRKSLNRVNNITYPSFTFRTPGFKQNINLVALALSHNRTSYAVRGF